MSKKPKIRITVARDSKVGLTIDEIVQAQFPECDGCGRGFVEGDWRERCVECTAICCSECMPMGINTRCVTCDEEHDKEST